MSEMLTPFLEIAKLLGMNGVIIFGIGYFVVFLAKQHQAEREAQRQAYNKERDEWKREIAEWRKQYNEMQANHLAVLNKTNEIDFNLTREIAWMRQKLSEK